MAARRMNRRGIFHWTPMREKIAIDLAHDEISDEKIAAKHGISRTGISKLKLEAEFMRRVTFLQDQIRERILKHGLAVPANRVARLTRRAEKMDQIIEERGASPDMKKVPGGTTGLLNVDFKNVGVGKTAKIIKTFSTDIALLKELRETEKQVAQELGQWLERTEMKGTTFYKVIKGVDMEKL